MGLLSRWLNRSDEEDKVSNLADEVSSTSQYDANCSFRFVVEDVFYIRNRGTVVTGRIDSGEIHVGDNVRINGGISCEVNNIENLIKGLDTAQAGDSCGILIKSITSNDVHRGDILTK